jgi:hypothetical protein
MDIGYTITFLSSNSPALTDPFFLSQAFESHATDATNACANVSKKIKCLEYSSLQQCKHELMHFTKYLKSNNFPLDRLKTIIASYSVATKELSDSEIRLNTIILSGNESSTHTDNLSTRKRPNQRNIMESNSNNYPSTALKPSNRDLSIILSNNESHPSDGSMKGLFDCMKRTLLCNIEHERQNPLDPTVDSKDGVDDSSDINDEEEALFRDESYSGLPSYSHESDEYLRRKCLCHIHRYDMIL